jgi:adenylate kinase
MIIIMLGAPGSGKGTQSEMLSDILNLPHLNMGEEFRKAIEDDSEWGTIAKQYIDKGELVPDEFTNDFLKELLLEPKYKVGCIFDGFPRTINQADALDKILFNKGKGIDRVINLDIDDDTIKERLLKRGRKDDTEEIVDQRIETYKNESKPLIQYYGEKKLLKGVKSKGKVEDVNAKILECLSY